MTIVGDCIPGFGGVFLAKSAAVLRHCRWEQVLEAVSQEELRGYQVAFGAVATHPSHEHYVGEATVSRLQLSTNTLIFDIWWYISIRLSWTVCDTLSSWSLKSQQSSALHGYW